MRIAALVLSAVLTSSITPAHALPAPPHVEGPDIPPATAPDRVVTAFEDERFECTEEARAVSIDIPHGDWDRVILEVTITPDGDPWDRLFGVAIAGVEVLRGTTPRTTFTLRKDVTRYARLLPPGGSTEVTLYMGSYVGALRGTIHLEFYADEPTAALVAGPDADHVPVVAWGSLGGDGSSIERAVTFGDEPPSRAAAELTLSGHGGEEFWYTGPIGPRIFHVFVDDIEVLTVVALPYVYALLGFGNENANTACVGPGTSRTGDLVHPVMWWSAHQALDAAGVHTGNGEIPPFRAKIDPSALVGARTIKVVQEGGAGRWVTSLSMLVSA